MLVRVAGGQIVTESWSKSAREAMVQAGVIKADEWPEDYSSGIVQFVRDADAEKRFLTDAELDAIAAQTSPRSGTIVRCLRDLATDIVTEARTNVLGQFPGITEPGGELYPEVRAESCWRDFWHFLRSTSYGIASENLEFVSAEGTRHMEILYRELNVPLAAMVKGVEALKVASMERLDGDRAGAVAPYFDRLIERLREFHA